MSMAKVKHTRTKGRCDAEIRSYQPFRLGLGGGCNETRQCENTSTFEVSVKGQGKMKLCDDCLIQFRKYATLPWSAKPIAKPAKQLA